MTAQSENPTTEASPSIATKLREGGSEEEDVFWSPLHDNFLLLLTQPLLRMWSHGRIYNLHICMSDRREDKGGHMYVCRNHQTEVWDQRSRSSSRSSSIWGASCSGVSGRGTHQLVLGAPQSRVVAASQWWQLAPFEPFEQDIRQNSGPVEHISIAAQLVPLGSGHYTNYHGHTHNWYH